MSSPADVTMVIGATSILNNSFIAITKLKADNQTLRCVINEANACSSCNQSYWFSPSGNLVTYNQNAGLYQSESQDNIQLHRNVQQGIDRLLQGLYSCIIRDISGFEVMLYVGLYSNDSSSGNLQVEGEFRLLTPHNVSIPIFLLICTSTGGPVSNVSWTRNGISVPQQKFNESFTRQDHILVNRTSASYRHTLKVVGRFVGDYQCRVQNNKPSQNSTVISFYCELIIK